MAIDQKFFKLNTITSVDELVAYLKLNGEKGIDTGKITEVPRHRLLVVTSTRIIVPKDKKIEASEGNYLLEVKGRWFIAEDEYYFYEGGNGSVIKYTSENVIRFLKSDQKVYIDPLETYINK